MYNEFFGFAESPFNITPNSRFYYRTPSCEDVLQVVRHGIEAKKGVIVVTGEPGTGKTLFLKSLARALSARVRTVILFNPQTDLNGLLKLLLNELDLKAADDNTAAMFERLAQFLIEERRNQRTICLLIDEAQDLDERTLDELRLLANLDFEDEALLPIVLSGQPELHGKLDHPAAKRIKQRIALACQTYPLVRMEVAPYIAHRLHMVNYSGPDLFDAKALEKIAGYSAGIPRMINSICDNCLLRAFAANRKTVTWEMVDRVAREMHLTTTLTPSARRVARNEPGLASVPVAVLDRTGSSAAVSAITHDGSRNDSFTASVLDANGGNLRHAAEEMFDRSVETADAEGPRDYVRERTPALQENASELPSQIEQNQHFQTQPPVSSRATQPTGEPLPTRGHASLYWYSLAAVVGLLLLVLGVNAGFPKLAGIYSGTSAPKGPFVAQEPHQLHTTEALQAPAATTLANEQTLTHPRLNLAALDLNARTQMDSVEPPRVNGTHGNISNGLPSATEHSSKSVDPEPPEEPAKVNGSKGNDRRNIVTVVSASLVRSKPADKAEIISTLEPGSRVTVLAKSRDYYLVRSFDPPIRGYVHREDAFFDRKN
jgi:general secretion pathway protein A